MWFLMAREQHKQPAARQPAPGSEQPRNMAGISQQRPLSSLVQLETHSAQAVPALQPAGGDGSLEQDMACSTDLVTCWHQQERPAVTLQVQIPPAGAEGQK